MTELQAGRLASGAAGNPGRRPHQALRGGVGRSEPDPHRPGVRQVGRLPGRASSTGSTRWPRSRVPTPRLPAATRGPCGGSRSSSAAWASPSRRSSSPGPCRGVDGDRGRRPWPHRATTGSSATPKAESSRSADRPGPAAVVAVGEKRAGGGNRRHPLEPSVPHGVPKSPLALFGRILLLPTQLIPRLPAGGRQPPSQAHLVADS